MQREPDGERRCPRRWADSTPIRPPCAATIPATIDRPRPVPWIARSWAVEERKNFWNRPACSSSGMPMPVSRDRPARPRRRAAPAGTAICAAVLGELDRVAEQVGQRPLELDPVAQHHDRLVAGSSKLDVEVASRAAAVRSDVLGVRRASRPGRPCSRSQLRRRRSRARRACSRSLQIVISRSPLRAIVSSSGSWCRERLDERPVARASRCSRRCWSPACAARG